MALLDDAKLLIGISGTSKDSLLALLETQVEQDFKDYTNQETIPQSANAVLLNMLVVQYNKIGAQGIASQSYSSVSENYIEGYPKNIIAQLNHYRKLKTV